MDSRRLSARREPLAFDSGNLLAVPTALRERYKDKPIIIAGDDDHRLENNCRFQLIRRLPIGGVSSESTI